MIRDWFQKESKKLSISQQNQIFIKDDKTSQETLKVSKTC